MAQQKVRRHRNITEYRRNRYPEKYKSTKEDINFAYVQHVYNLKTKVSSIKKDTEKIN